jgi:hypothetical protein
MRRFFVSNEQTLVNQALEAYAAAVHAKDVDAFAALYNDNVHIYDSWGQWQYTGIESWRPNGSLRPATSAFRSSSTMCSIFAS